MRTRHVCLVSTEVHHLPHAANKNTKLQTVASAVTIPYSIERLLERLASRPRVNTCAMPPLSNANNCGGTFDRNNPLFERQRVPCQFQSDVGGGNAISSNFNGNAGVVSKTICYTIRILEGRRPCGGGGGMERCIRFEISDECAHHAPFSSSYLGLGSPLHAPPILSAPSASSVSCSGDPPMMQMQMQMQPINRTANHQPYYMCHAESGMHCRDTTCAAKINAAAATINTYELEVGETDFAQLRRDQALLVDFGSFADSFISLLGYCDLGQEKDEEEQRTNQPPQTQNPNQNQPTPPRTPYSTELPRYICRLKELSSAATTCSRGGSTAGGSGGGARVGPPLQARFSIVESNQFRELTHLSLNLHKGTDTTIRSYLSSRLHQTMAENTALRCNLKQQIGRADDGQAQIREMAQQMQQMATTFEIDKASIVAKADEALEKETTRLSEESQRRIKEKEDQMQSMATKQEEETTALNGRISTLEDQVDLLFKDKTSAEYDNAKLRDKVRQQADAIETLSKDLSAAKSQVEQLNKEKTAASTSLHEAQIRIATLEQSKISQEQALDQSNALRKVAEVGATTANDTINAQSSQLQEARDRIAELETELTTSQETLSRYQRDRADVKQQVKEKSDELAQRDNLMAAKTEENTALRSKLNDVESKFHRLQIDKQAVESELVEAKEKLQESAKLLLSNQHVITYLNREINNAQLGRVGNAGTCIGSGGGITTTPAIATCGDVGAFPGSGLGRPPLSSHNAFAAPSPSKRCGSFSGGIGSGGGTRSTELGPHSSYYSSSLAGLNSYLPPASTSRMMPTNSSSGDVCPPPPSPAPAPPASLPPAPATCPRPTSRTLEKADLNSHTYIAGQVMKRGSKTPPR